ncbi:MAG: translation initiation factor IF-2 [Magnetococcales bacterium]|nr:translation initiation factor IF-2 [Magnetococcales bacterium]
MSDTKKSPDGEKKLRLKAPRKIVLRKTVEGGSVKQNFSHGRSKSVVVEVRRKRTFVKSEGESGSGRAGSRGGTAQQGGSARDQQDGAGSQKSSSQRPQKQQILQPMTDDEKRAFELEKKKKREAEALAAKERAAQEALEAKERAEREAKEAKEKAEQEAREAKERAEQEAKEAEARAAEAAAKAKEATEKPAETQAEPETPPAEQKVKEEPAEKVAAAPESAPDAAPKKAAETPKEAAKAEPVATKKPAADTSKKPKAAEKTKQAAPAAKVLDQEKLVEEADGILNEKPDEKAKKMTRHQRDEMARKKVEALMAKRLAQREEMRELKRVQEERRKTSEEEERRRAQPGVKRKGRKGAGVPQGGAGAAGVGRGGGGRGRGRRRRGRAQPQEPIVPPTPVVRDVQIPETITVGELAARMAVKASEVVKLLFGQGMMVTINQTLDQDTAVLVVEEMGHKAIPISEEAAIAAELADKDDDEGTLVSRNPVVTVMGHVDHGKTSLLDAIRETDVTSREHGGITQHIGAYQVNLASGDKITFLDTPGHAAFTAMRSRGAKVTDIVVLVVAADDGVMPQTVEAVNHSKAAGVNIIVAVNKMDKEGANPDRIKQQLSEFELIPEEWGGETMFIPVSAHSGEGLTDLEEMISLQAEMMTLKANPDKRARGAVVEAKLDRGRGVVATCLVQNGTLRDGDVFVVGAEWGRVRVLLNDRGKKITEAPPGTPVEIIGLSGVPNAGDDLVVVQDERRARDIAAFRQHQLKEQEQAKNAPAKLDDLFSRIKEGEKEELKVVVKADVHGSVEAVADALAKIDHEQIKGTVIHSGVGGINESDVMLAIASNAIVFGFNVRADAKARELAKREGIELRFYNVIYDLMDDVRQAMEGQLAPRVEETVLGMAAVREVFRISKVGNIAGCQVAEGVVRYDAKARLLRDNVVIFEGPIAALKRFKDDAKEVKEGMECGIALERFNDIKTGDSIEVYTEQEVRQTIEM